MKKGQAALFVIIGLLLLIMLGLLFMLAEEKEPLIEVPGELKSKADMYVKTCLGDVARRGAIVMAVQGGRIVLSGKYIQTDELYISYGHFRGIHTLASLPEMENELGRFIDSELLACVDNFSGFHEEVNYEAPKTQATIGSDSVSIKTIMHVRINNEIQDTFTADVLVPLGKLHSNAYDIVENLDPDWVDISYLSNLPVQINIQPYNGSVIYYLTDGDFMFNFATFNEINRAPVLEVPDEITVPDGIPWLYKVNCTDPDGDSIVITDNTAMLETMEDGSILSTPEIPGEYSVIFTCKDSHNNRADKAVMIKVE